LPEVIKIFYYFLVKILLRGKVANLSPFNGPKKMEINDELFKVNNQEEKEEEDEDKEKIEDEDASEDDVEDDIDDEDDETF